MPEYNVLHWKYLYSDQRLYIFQTLLFILSDL